MKLRAGLSDVKFQCSGRVPFFLVMGLLNLAISLLTSLLGSVYRPESFSTDIFDGWSLVAVFFVSVIAGPFVETLIYQFALIEGTLYYTGKNRRGVFLAMFVSAFIFGVSHSYNLVYMAAAMCMGLSLALTYIQFKRRHNISPFIGVYAIHSCINLVAFIVNDLL